MLIMIGVNMRRRQPNVGGIVLDECTGEKTANRYPISLLRVPHNKSSGRFNKPDAPVVGQVIDA